jgi:hypothetical protein
MGRDSEGVRGGGRIKLRLQRQDIKGLTSLINFSDDLKYKNGVVFTAVEKLSYGRVAYCGGGYWQGG